MLRKRLIAPLLVLIASACANQGTATVHVIEERQASPERIRSDEALTIVALSSFTGKDIIHCMEQALRDEAPDLKIVSPEKFRNSLFPLFEPATAPRSAEDLAALMGKPMVTRRIAEFGVRYVVALRGQTKSTEETWGQVYGAGTRGGFAIGGISVDLETDLHATILDLKSARPVAEMEAWKSGHFKAGIFIFVPYLIASPTEAVTCKTLAQRVVGYMSAAPLSPDAPLPTNNKK